MRPGATREDLAAPVPKPEISTPLFGRSNEGSIISHYPECREAN